MRTISDYNALDANDLVIYGPADSAYHVVLASPSIGIEDEFAIGVYDDGDGRICPYGRDAILIDGPLDEEIRIRSIESLEPAELEALLVEFGAGDDEAAAIEPEQIL